MKILNIPISYRCKEQAMALYNDLKQQTLASDIVLIDNSPDPSEVPDTPDTVWVGRTNLGFGGC
jgi:hypothetical protein